MTQTQNTTILPNIFNLTSQPTGTTRATAGGSGSQSNATSNVNTGGGYFPHFGTVGANPIRGFGTFGSNNTNPPPGNNNNNNPPPPPPPLPPLPPPGFGGRLGGGFNPPQEEMLGIKPKYNRTNKCTSWSEFRSKSCR